MKKRSNVAIAVISFAIGLAALVGVVALWAHGAQSLNGAAAGQRLYRTGIGSAGRPVSRIGGMMPMMSAGCAGCHGIDGHGRVTAMFAAPNITYANLTDLRGMLQPDGTRGPTYTDPLIQRAVVRGIDPQGQPLAWPMPRWDLSSRDWTNLLSYLKK